MGVLGTFVSVVGFGFGIPIGLLLGYLLFICFKPDDDVKDPVMRPLCELDSKTLHQLLPDIPMWVKNPDYERVDWMNKFVGDMWPYLDKAICDTIRSTAKPIFDEYIGRFQLESIEFEHLTLGSFPPTISGMKVYEVQDKELIIEPWVRWAGNTNIVIGLRWFSLKMSVQLTELQISLAPRITLKPLVPTFPCFSSIFISLMEKPHIDFGLKILGADIMAIPGLYRLAQETIKEQVSNLYHWPQCLELPILDGSCANTKKPVGILHVKVVRAVNLRKMDILGKSDPYVKLSLGGERLPSKKTTIKMNNLNPEWNEHFKLIVKDPKTQVLQLHAYDWEKVKAHDKLGMQVVPLSMLIPHETKEFTLDLLKNMNPNDPQNRKNRGKITVELRFDPFKEDTNKFSGILDGDGNDSHKKITSSQGGVLSVTIERAEDIEGKHHNNPYAVIHLGGEMRKTKRIHKTHDPRWNEEFQFMLEEEPIDQKIHIEVLSKKRGFTFFWKETLGHVEVNLTDVVHNGRINEKYHLVNSRNGVIHVEIRWSTV